MRAGHDAKQGYYTTVATKISFSDKQKLCVIASSFQMTFYELLQSLLLAIVRYFDKDTPVSEENEKMIDAFTNVMTATAGSFSPLAVKDYQNQSIKGAILFIQRRDGQRPQTIAIKKDAQGRLTETYNQDRMLADYLQATDPEIYKVLDNERKRMELFSIGHTLHQIIMQSQEPTTYNMSEDIRSMFDDMRIPSGQAVNDCIYYKRKKNVGDYTQHYQRQSFRADLNPK